MPTECPYCGQNSPRDTSRATPECDHCADRIKRWQDDYVAASRLVRKIGDIAAKLRGDLWKHVRFNGSSTGPTAVAAEVIDLEAGEGWPDTKKLREVFNDFQRARSQIKMIWEKLPEERRRGLPDPDHRAT